MPHFDLSVRDMVKTYGRVSAVAGISFDVPPGQIVSLLGPSGCGKTTTLRAIVGLTAPTAGSVSIKGRDVTHVSVHRRNIGMLFQNYALFPHLTVAENVAFGLKLRGTPAARIHQEVAAALALVSMEGYGARYVSQLSGGQQQRVALARALVIRPDLLLLDEPFGALDRKLREHMQIEMRNLQARLGITTILVTHDQEEALTLSDTIIVMNEGRIEQMGAPADIYERPSTPFVADFIGVSNLFRGRLERAGDRWSVATDEGVRIGVATVSGELRDGHRVIATVRPERIRLLPAGASDETVNTVPVTIEQTVYRGGQTYHYLRGAEGFPLIAAIPSQNIAGIGDIDATDGGLVAAWEPVTTHLMPETA